MRMILPECVAQHAPEAARVVGNHRADRQFGAASEMLLDKRAVGLAGDQRKIRIGHNDRVRPALQQFFRAAHRVRRTQLRVLQHIAGFVAQFGFHLLRAAADHHHRRLGAQAFDRAEDIFHHGFAQQLVQHLGFGGFHARAHARCQDQDVNFLVSFWP